MHFRALVVIILLAVGAASAQAQTTFQVTAVEANAESLGFPSAKITYTEIAADVYEENLVLGDKDTKALSAGGGMMALFGRLGYCGMKKITKATGKNGIYASTPSRTRGIGHGLLAFVTPGEGVERFSAIPEFSAEKVRTRWVEYADFRELEKRLNAGGTPAVKCDE